MRYIVLWATRPELKPSKEFLPLEVTGHPSLSYWYQEFEKAAVTCGEIGIGFASLITQAEIQDTGSLDNIRWGGSLFEAASLNELRTKVAKLRWDELPA